ncbi:glucosamine-6-phosphate deaminase [Bacillaceae bacterium]
MKLHVVKDREEMSELATEMVLKQLRRKPDSVLGLATGETPIGLYRKLVERGADFSEVTTFNLDEYYPISRNHPQSFFQFMKRYVYDPLKPKRHYIPDGECDDPEQECRRYEALIRIAGGIDLQILGVGRNGHIGFNEPGTPFASRTRLVALREETIEDNSRFFANKEDVPRKAITMGIATIMEARSVLLLAFGARKAEAIAALFHGEISEAIPVTVLRRHPSVTVVVDEKAASRLTEGHWMEGADGRR